MKKLIFLLLLSSCIYAQKERKVLFDADTTTRPGLGFYGIGVRDSKPYLIRNNGDNLLIETSPTKLKGWQFNLSGTAPSDVQILAINKDSLTIDLPNATDSANASLSYTVCYFGFKDSVGLWADNTYLLSFIDTIYAYSSTNLVTYWTNNFTHNHTYYFFRIKPYDALYLYVDKKKWWLSGNPFKY